VQLRSPAPCRPIDPLIPQPQSSRPPPTRGPKSCAGFCGTYERLLRVPSLRRAGRPRALPRATGHRAAGPQHHGDRTDTPTLVRDIRENHPDLPVLHIGSSALDGMPTNVPTLAESFTADQLLLAVELLMPAGGLPASLPSEEAHSFQAELNGLLTERAAIRRRSERPGRRCQKTTETVCPITGGAQRGHPSGGEGACAVAAREKAPPPILPGVPPRDKPLALPSTSNPARIQPRGQPPRGPQRGTPGPRPRVQVDQGES
jgi:hypothetical protein